MRTSRRVVLAAVAAASLWPTASAAAQETERPGSPCPEQHTSERRQAIVHTVQLATAPPMPQASFVFDGQQVPLGPDGRAMVQTGCLDDLADRVRVLAEEFPVAEGVRARLHRIRTNKAIVFAEFNLDYLVTFRFIESANRNVANSRVDSFTVKSSTGEVRTITSTEPQWLHGVRVVPSIDGPQARRIYYSIERVSVDGVNVVNRAQQGLFPSETRSMDVTLLFFKATFRSRDAFFSFPVGSALQLVRPDGRVERHRLDRRGRVVVGSLPRGDYHAVVEGPGLRLPRPVSLSRDQNLELKVFTWLDIGIVAGGLIAVLTGLAFGRRVASRRLRGVRRDRAGPRVASLLARVRAGAGRVVIAVAVAGLVVGASRSPAAAATPDDDPTPVLAYYYIWFNATSWNRAKTDFPTAGRYSSDEASVMREHMRLARAAGIDGFIVSWKSTPVLDARLALLVSVAEAERFKLAIIYQGLDFERAPLPAPRVGADLDTFVAAHGDSPAFAIFDKPLVIWSGTWKVAAEDIAAVTGPRRDQLLLLASERNPDDYARVAAAVDGNAYYWTGVDPETSQWYGERLAEFGETVHRGGGIWIPPAAPGFDARLVGGERVVDRKDGATFRRTINAAVTSSPDAIGVISWNEFSENTHIEPSRRHGTRSLEVLRDMLGTPAPGAADFDSNAPEGQDARPQRALVLGGLAALVLASSATIGRRRQRARLAAHTAGGIG